MNILYANKFFFLNGGSETVLFQERRFMQEAGHTVMDFSMRDPRNFPSPWSEFFTSPVNYRQGTLRSRLAAAASFVRSAEAVRKLKALLRVCRPDIAHLHNIYHQLTPSIIPVLQDAGVKVVMTLHDGKLACPGYLMLDKGRPCLDCAGRATLLPLRRHCQGARLSEALLAAEACYHVLVKSYDGVDAFIAPSAFMAGVAALRVRRERIALIRNGIDPDTFIPADDDDGYILFAGRLSREKGLETLLSAHGAMRRKCRLIIAGTGPEAERLRTLAGPDVVFAGHCSGEVLRRTMGRAACVVAPSECYENCSMSVMEAMALARPVVASDIGGIPEQVAHGKTGLLHAPGNAGELSEALDALMADNDARRAMGRAGRARLEASFSLSGHTTALLALYQNLLAR